MAGTWSVSVEVEAVTRQNALVGGGFDRVRPLTRDQLALRLPVRELFARHKGRRAVDQWNGSTSPPYSLPGTSRVLRIGISGMTMLITNANRAIPIAM